MEKMETDQEGFDSISLTTEDCAFILGKHGMTKDRIALVSGTVLDLSQPTLKLNITGRPDRRILAKKYAEWVIAQRTGHVVVKKEDLRDHCTVVNVPSSTVGFVTGKSGNFLRMIENEWSVIMFFFSHDDDPEERESEKLGIFGDPRNRRGAELKIMSTVEHKVPGYYTDQMELPLKEYDVEDDFGTETRQIDSGNLGYALGKKGTTRRKIAAASECIVEYVNNIIFFSGTRQQIGRGKQYFSWLFEQSEQFDKTKAETSRFAVDTESRNDCTVVLVPSDCVGYVTGRDRDTLSRIEEEKSVLMFFCDKQDKVAECERLAIFGPLRNRTAALLKVKACVENKKRGSFVESMREVQHPEVAGFAIDVMKLKEESISYALGKEGSTRRKLANASNCVLEYIGCYACMAGTKKERDCCRDYLRWLCDQRGTRITVRNSEIEGRDDCTELRLRSTSIQYINLNKGRELRRIEIETSTFCFTALDDRGKERLLIFSNRPQANRRTGKARAEKMIRNLLDSPVAKQKIREFYRPYDKYYDWQSDWWKGRSKGRLDFGKKESLRYK